MELTRKIEKTIDDFILNSGEREKNNIHKALLINGLRQVGKTHTIRKCLNLPIDDFSIIVSSFKNKDFVATSIHLDFHLHPEYGNIFSMNYDALQILNNLYLFKEFSHLDLKPHDDNKIILFLDEIQDAEGAIDALKYLSYQKNLIVIASGSLLGVSLNQINSFPVGYVQMERMYPLDFEEYMWAKGYDERFIATLITHASKFNAIPSPTHENLIALYKQYILVGGMPEIVAKYVNLNNISKENLYSDLLQISSALRMDIGKYSDVSTKKKAEDIYVNIPSSIAKERSRFFYSDVDKFAKAKNYEIALSWLVDAGLVYKVFNVSKPAFPIRNFEKLDSFKLYIADPGLYFALSGLDLINAIDDGMDTPGKGPIFENAGCSNLISIQNPLHYYSDTKGLEVDFIISMQNKICFIEVKSSLNRHSKSLNKLLDINENALGIRVSFRNVGKKDRLISLPCYLLPFINKIIK